MSVFHPAGHTVVLTVMDVLPIVSTISFATALCTLNLLSSPASIPLKPILVPSWVPSIYVYTLSAVPPCCLSVLQVSHDSLFGFLSQTIVCSATVDCADYFGCYDDNGCFIEYESAVLCMHLGHTVVVQVYNIQLHVRTYV